MLGIYIRKSRERKKEKSIKEQKLLGQEFALDNNLEYKYYDEGIISGQKQKEQRPKFAELLKDIENKKITGVFIWDSSRLARNEIAWHTFADLLKKTGTILYDNGVKTDFRDENTYLFYTIKAGMDAHFARLTAKKIKTVLRRNAKEGTPHGLLPYGYKKDSKDKWQKHEDEINTVKLIFELFQKGYGYIRIANHLNEIGIATRYNIEWTPSTIRYMIYNKTYSGTAMYADIEIKAPPIIDKQIHEKLLDDISNRYKKPGAKSKKYILNEVLICGKCGTRYTITARTRHTYYRCLSAVNRGVENCHSKAVSAEPLDNVIFDHILLGNELYELAHKTYLEGGNLKQKEELITKEGYQKKRFDKLKEELKRNHQVYVIGGVELDLYMVEKKRIDSLIYKTEKNIKMLSDELKKLENTDRLLEQMSIDFNFDLPEKWQNEKNTTIKAWMEHSIKEAIKTNRIDRNKEKIKETITFDEKVAMVEKYIKQITINYHRVPLRIKVEFNIPVPPMELIMESRYYGVKNLTTNKNFYLKDFGKQPNRIYKRMHAEFDNYTESLRK
ncbi:recombinase family protein [Cellulophaga sp. Asnod2-G02]|uniref:recombinase family protein n=1 Tax=Cellulophaga sp. Asnod2-G02 TaxID=3160572 RepID=UPI003866CF97